MYHHFKKIVGSFFFSVSALGNFVLASLKPHSHQKLFSQIRFKFSSYFTFIDSELSAIM